MEKVLICVKTYPTLSCKYKELVCTAGFREDGSWIRLYPIPFRMLNSENQYTKWQWIELDIVKNVNDDRTESYRPLNPKSLVLGDRILSDGGPWRERRKYALRIVHHNLNELIIAAKQEGGPSLATFKPMKVIDFFCKAEKNLQWSERQLASVAQTDLFEEDHSWYKEVRKLPFKFYYHFMSSNGSVVASRHPFLRASSSSISTPTERIARTASPTGKLFDYTQSVCGFAGVFLWTGLGGISFHFPAHHR